jgi:hypothetical protein
MKLNVKLILLLILLGVVVGLLPSLGPVAQDSPPDVCQEGENIMPNCNFDGGVNGWTPFIEEGAANFSVLQGGGECHAPLCPAGYIVTESHFVGGIYQQVPVVKGNTYFANVVWLAFDSFANDKSVNAVAGGIGRRIGIDPFGGADPRSPNVIWGPENWRNDCKICANQEVTAQAQADVLTVFLRIDDRWRLRAAEKGYAVPPSKDQFWIDDIGLKQVAGSVAPAVAPTDTPVPPTDTPIPEPPTATPAPATEEPQEEVITSLADAPTEIAQVKSSSEAEAVSPIATPAPVNVIAPPPTLTPSATPSPTATLEERERPHPTPTRTRRPTPTPEAAPLSAGMLGVAGTTICVGGGFLGLMGAVLTGLVWLYRLGWGKVDDDDDADEEEIIVEIVEDDE